MPFVTISSIGGVVGRRVMVSYLLTCFFPSVAHEDDLKVQPRLKGSMPDAKPWIDVSQCTWWVFFCIKMGDHK